MMLRLALVLAAGLALLSPAPATAQQFTGSGSTFAYQLLVRWSQAYQRAQRDAEYQPVGALFDYEAIGSEAGVMRLRERAVDFAATEVPLSDEELARYNAAQFPIVAGGIALVTNLEGITAGRLRLTGDVIAEIYRGRITRWSEPAIRGLNPGLALPDAAIVPVRRAEGSGTTAAFTTYLSTVSTDWRSAVGQGQTVRWPVGVPARGNLGVATTVRNTPNAIGYVDVATARVMNLAPAALRNRSGAFVTPDAAPLEAALVAAAGAGDLRSAIIDSPAAEAYPLLATVFVAMPRETASAGRIRAMMAFFAWSLDNGNADARALGYVALPPVVAAKVRSGWASLSPALR
jgi:phosphate transport system substrate-binding protein